MRQARTLQSDDWWDMALVIGEWCDIEPMSYFLASAEDL